MIWHQRFQWVHTLIVNIISLRSTVSSDGVQLIPSNRLNHYQLLLSNWRHSINEYPLFTARCNPLPHSADS
jgi:hypothetical protein